jgi:four helix bundle protein
MSRDPNDLRVFVVADALAVEVYAATRRFPVEERFGLRGQIRRAAVSVPTNLVEGCARRTLGEYIHFVSIAAGSAAEVRYLLGLASRLGFAESTQLVDRYSELVRSLQALLCALEDRRSGPEA